MRALERVIRELELHPKDPRLSKETIEQAAAVLDRLSAIIKGYEMALDEVYKAYPVDVFPENPKELIQQVHKEHPGFVDRASASMGRHIAGVIKRRAAEFTQDILEEQ